MQVDTGDDDQSQPAVGSVVGFNTQPREQTQIQSAAGSDVNVGLTTQQRQLAQQAQTQQQCDELRFIKSLKDLAAKIGEDVFGKGPYRWRVNDLLQDFMHATKLPEKLQGHNLSLGSSQRASQPNEQACRLAR